MNLQPFIEVCVLEPSDPKPRLALADFLEEADWGDDFLLAALRSPKGRWIVQTGKLAWQFDANEMLREAYANLVSSEPSVAFLGSSFTANPGIITIGKIKKMPKCSADTCKEPSVLLTDEGKWFCEEHDPRSMMGVTFMPLSGGQFLGRPVRAAARIPLAANGAHVNLQPFIAACIQQPLASEPRLALADYLEEAGWGDDFLIGAMRHGGNGWRVAGGELRWEYNLTAFLRSKYGGMFGDFPNPHFDVWGDAARAWIAFDCSQQIPLCRHVGPCSYSSLTADDDGKWACPVHSKMRLPPISFQMPMSVPIPGEHLWSLDEYMMRRPMHGAGYPALADYHYRHNGVNRWLFRANASLAVSPRSLAYPAC